MERVVLDPAVLVSALISPLGNPAALWRAVRDERVEIITSPQLLAELARVLARPKFRRYATVEEVEAFVAEVARYGTPLPDPANPPPVSRDPNDDYLVALALFAPLRRRWVASGEQDSRCHSRSTLLASLPGHRLFANENDGTEALARADRALHEGR